MKLRSFLNAVNSMKFTFSPVVTRADFIAAGLHVGWIALSRATIPDMWGQDMEVPDSILKVSGDLDGERTGDQEAKILTPGAVISGCTTHSYK